MFRKRPELSRARRIARRVVWIVFAAVVTARILFPPERPPQFGRGPGGFGQDQRYRRPPTRINPPASEVPSDLWRIHIEIAPAGVAKLRNYFWNGWRGATQERTDVSATVREGGVIYTNVALHLKGAAGSFRPFDDKPALTLNFSKNAPAQRFHGFSKISLNNSMQDPSFLAEAISREMFLAAGVPAPRADHATVLINGRDLGLYVLTEGFGKTFLKRHFKDVRGNLYDSGFVQDINGSLDTNSGDHPDDRSDLRRLVRAATNTDKNPVNRWKGLCEVLDMDRFITFLAMETMTCHWDGYGRNRNNYRVFHDLETDRMVFFPHGLDQMFGWPGGRSSTTDSIEVPMQGMAAGAVLSTPEGSRRYFERIAALRTNVFLVDKLTNRVLELSRRIRPTLAAYSGHQAEEHDRQVADLCRRIADRAQSITEQLNAPKPEPSKPIEFDANGTARLSGWSRRIAPQQGGVIRFTREEIDEKAALRIAASRGGGTGSWRTRALLPAGRYRFAARFRTSGLRNVGGVCLRISGVQVNALRESDNGWSELQYRFVVDEPESQVELICEMRARTGEAWFEEESLRLIRE